MSANALLTTVDLDQLLHAQDRNYPPNLRIAEPSKDYDHWIATLPSEGSLPHTSGLQLSSDVC